MARLVVKLLGCFQATLDGQPLTGSLSDKGGALLAYLVLEADRPHRRETLAEMLWPNKPMPNGRANLRQTLHRLHIRIGDPIATSPVLLSSPQDVQFNYSSSCWIDTSEFSRLLHSVNTHHPTDLMLCEVCLRRLQYAAILYQGDLLAGFSLPDCPDFDWWLLCKIEEYHRQAMFMLDRLVIHLKHNSDYSIASRYAQRAIELEPWCERSHRMKMRALALSGNTGAAIRQYEICRKILAAEMGVDPSQKTKNLLEQIQFGIVKNLSNLVDEYQLTEPLAV